MSSWGDWGRGATAKTRPLTFEVEGTITVSGTGQAFVIARQVAPAQWELGDDPSLGGVRIYSVAESPRAVDEAGNQRQDLFAFCLREAAEIAAFSSGQLVELKL